VTWLRPRSRHRIGRRLRTLCHAACAFLASTAITSEAFGEGSFALSWRSPAGGGGCITEPALRDAVERKLGRNPFADVERADVFIEGKEIAAGHGELRARVAQRNRRGVLLGSRDIEAQSCASLLRAATLVVALIIDARSEGASREPPEPGPPESPREAPPPATEVDRASTPPQPPPTRAEGLRPARPSPVARSPTTFALALGGGAATSVGVLPSPSAIPFAFARLESRSRWSFDWRAGYSVPQSIVRPDVRGRFAVLEQHVRACFAFVRWTTGNLDGCAGWSWGAVFPSTSGVRHGDDSARVIAGPTGSAGVELGRNGAAVRVDLGATFPFREYTFSYFDVANVRRPLYSTQGVIFFVSLSGLGTISP